MRCPRRRYLPIVAILALLAPTGRAPDARRGRLTRRLGVLASQIFIVLCFGAVNCRAQLLENRETQVDELSNTLEL